LDTEDETESSSSDEETSQLSDSNDEASDISSISPPIKSFFELGEQRERRIKRFGVIGYERDINLRNMGRCGNIFEVLPDIFDAAISEILDQNVEESMIIVSYEHPDLNQPILIPFRPNKSVNGQILAEKI